MSKVIIIVLVVIVVLVIGCLFFFNSTNSYLKNYEHLKQPRISTIKGQRVIEITLKGDPNATGGKAIGQLYSTFYQLKNNQIKQAAPRARWPESLEIKKENWIGIYALPVSDTVQELPKQKNKSGIAVKLTTWEYGTVAEILHIGPYSAEMPTIAKLKQFINDNGYEIIGEHEEEYLKGPGLWPTNPQDYYTIIRYRVQKKG